MPREVIAREINRAGRGERFVPDTLAHVIAGFENKPVSRPGGERHSRWDGERDEAVIGGVELPCRWISPVNSSLGQCNWAASPSATTVKIAALLGPASRRPALRANCRLARAEVKSLIADVALLSSQDRVSNGADSFMVRIVRIVRRFISIRRPSCSWREDRRNRERSDSSSNFISPRKFSALKRINLALCQRVPMCNAGSAGL